MTIALYDGLVNLDHPVTVKVNGEVLVDKRSVARDWDIFINNVLPRRFFMLPVVAMIDCSFERKAQFEEPKVPEKER